MHFKKDISFNFMNNKNPKKLLLIFPSFSK